MAKSLVAVRPAFGWRSDRKESGPTAKGGGPTGCGLVRRPAGRRCVVVRSSSWVSLHMCCMIHVLANVGQVVKNLFPEMVSWSIAVRLLAGL